MISKHVLLKPGKDKAIRHRHHWIFSGAIQSLPDFQNGDILPVFSAQKELLGHAYFNRKSTIIGRMVAFNQESPMETIRENIYRAIQLRKQLIDPTMTNAYRLINGEGDSLPGLIVDQYNGNLVIQVGTQGIEKIKSTLISYLIEACQPTSIYEKSTMPSRKEEGFTAPFQGHVYGDSNDEIAFKENGLNFSASLSKSQKTGFFLDHRHMRQRIRSLSKGRRVLNAFAYTGGFSVYAMAGGARAVRSVDISAEAIDRAKINLSLNHFDTEAASFLVADVFNYLREETTIDYDLVVLDPPAFAKKRADIVPACRGYKDINRLAMQKMPSNSLLLTCSCSQLIDETLFQQVIFQAALEANRKAKIISKHELALDHPVNIFHPESNYLKSLLLYIE